MPDFIDKYGIKLILGLAAAFGLAAGPLRLGGSAFAIGVTGITTLALLLERRSWRKRKDAGAWQAQIDREYRPGIDGTNVTLYRSGTVVMRLRRV